MNKNVIFSLDEFPLNLCEIEGIDHNAKFVLSFLYKSLFFKYNGHYISEGIEDYSDGKLLKFKFSENSTWSDGSQLNAEDFYNTLKYIIFNKLGIASYLNFIVGVKEYLFNEGNFKNIHFWIDNNCFFAEVYTLSLYKEVFSSICFAPRKILENNTLSSLTSSGYTIQEITTDKIEIKNQIFNKNPKKISFIVVKESEKQLDLLKNNDIFYTGFTSLTFNSIQHRNPTSLKSDILVRLIFSEHIFSIFKSHNIEIDFFRNISENDILKKLLNIKSNHNNLEHGTSDSDTIPLPNISILFPDYYPNQLIIDELDYILLSKGYSLKKYKKSLKEFTQCDFSHYDIILELIEPITLNKLDYWIEQIQYINLDSKNNFVQHLNKYINSPTTNIQNEIEQIINSQSRCIQIGNLKQYYLSSQNSPKLVLSDNGLISIKKTFQKGVNI